MRILLYVIPLLLVNQRENFLSLLHYFGLLSMRGIGNDTPRLGIPNQTVRRLLYGLCATPTTTWGCCPSIC